MTLNTNSSVVVETDSSTLLGPLEILMLCLSHTRKGLSKAIQSSLASVYTFQSHINHICGNAYEHHPMCKPPALKKMLPKKLKNLKCLFKRGCKNSNIKLHNLDSLPSTPCIENNL